MRGANDAPLSLRFDSRQTHRRQARRDLAQAQTLSLKAVSFALIGLLNTAVDYSVFLLAQAAYQSSPPTVSAFAALAAACRCGAAPTIVLIAANITSWMVAVSISYILNSSITFAAESGRRLRWRHYLAFLAAGIVGLIANTATLVFAAQVLLLAGVSGKSFGDPGELHRQFLAIAFCGVSGARQIVGAGAANRASVERRTARQGAMPAPG